MKPRGRIPPLPRVEDPELARFLNVLKLAVEELNGSDIVATLAPLGNTGPTLSDPFYRIVLPGNMSGGAPSLGQILGGGENGGNDAVNAFSPDTLDAGVRATFKDDTDPTDPYEYRFDLWFDNLPDGTLTPNEDYFAFSDASDLDPDGQRLHKRILGSDLLSALGGVPGSRTINTTAPLAGGGNLSADRTLTLAGLSSVGTSGQMLRSTGAAWEYRSPAQVLSDIGGAAAVHTHAYTDVVSVPTDRLLGRDTAGTGAAEAITVGGGLEFTGSGGIQRSALTGDVTATAGGTVLTIANDAVTYAKMQNVSATDRLLGRATAGAGDVEEITCTSFARTLLDDADAAAARTTLDAAQASHAHSAADITSGTLAVARGGTGLASYTAGDVLYASAGTTLSKLGIGTNGQVLTVVSGAPAWATPSGGITGSGAANRAAFWSGAAALDYDDAFVWDDTNKRLGIGTTSPEKPLHVVGTSYQARFAYDGSKYWHIDVDTGQYLNLRGSNTTADMLLVGTGANASIQITAAASHEMRLYADTFNFYTWAGAAASLAVKLRPTSGKQSIVGTATGATSLSYLQFEDDSGGNIGYVGDTGSNSALQLGVNNSAYPLSLYADKIYLQNAAGTGNASVVCGAAALAGAATDGFLYIPTVAGAPSGTPTAQTGTVAMLYDTTNNKLYIYNGAWKSATFA